MESRARGLGLRAEGWLLGQAELSVGFVSGVTGIAWLFAGVAPVVCLWAGLVMPPCRLVEDRQALEGLAGQGL